MSDKRLPPLRLNSAMSINSNESNNNDITGSNISLNSRERRRQKLKEQIQAKEEFNQESGENSTRKIQSEVDSTNPKKNRRGRALPQTDNSNTNLAYDSDEKNKVLYD